MKAGSTRYRLWSGLVVVAILPLAGLSWFYLSSFETTLKAMALQTISSIADKKADEIDDFVNERIVDVRLASQLQHLPRLLADLSDAFQRGGLTAAHRAEQGHDDLLATLKELAHYGRYYDMLLIDVRGNVVYSLAQEADLGSNLISGPYRASGLAQGYRQAMRSLHIDLTHFGPYAPSNGKIATFVVAPVLDNGQLVGAIALQLNYDAIAAIVNDRTGLGLSGETTVARLDGNDVLFTAPLRRIENAQFRHRVALAEAPFPMRRALLGERARGITEDYAGHPVAAAWRHIPSLHWGMVVKIDADEAFAPARSVRRLTQLTLFAFIVFSIGAGLMLGRRLVRAEDDLRKSHDQLNEAQRIAGIGNWNLDIPNRRFDCSGEALRIFGIEQASSPLSYEALIERIHPEDRDRVRAMHERSLHGTASEDAHYRLQLAGGRIKHVWEHRETTTDPHGIPIASHGTVQDVTATRHAEEEIRLYANIFLHSGEAIVITDTENRILAVNAAFTRLTGYPLDEVVGKDPKILASGQTPRETFQALWDSLRETDFWQGELSDRRKDGTVYPKWATISVIRNEAGEVTHHIASFTNISERKAAEERIRQLAHQDALTGLFNRFSLENRLEQALHSARRQKTQLAVMFIDMDHFKLINDTLGHQLGDLLLVEVADRLRNCARESDIIARLGGDEFVVVITGLAETMAAAPIAGKIVETLSRPYSIEGHLLHTSPSVGISVFPNDGDDAAILMKCADTAMYEAKRRGRGNYRFFTAAMTEAAGERLHIEHGLRQALAENHLELHFQPQVLTASGRICGVEALLRWRDPAQGLIPPLRFVPVAEETGLIEPLGDWVLTRACQQLAEWKNAGITDLRVAVNLSAHQLRNPKLLTYVRATIAAYGLLPGELELEITESAAMENPERAIDQLRALRALGIDLAIDDFGTGYSSLAYLKLLPIQTLKLDRTFVRDIETDENDAAISAATLALAHNLGLRVVAEGVETNAQRQFLAAHGCDILQGYLFSEPLTASEAGEFLHRHQSPDGRVDPV